MENYEEQKRSNELANRLWDIANTLRGNMDASKFKNYILGIIFYRYLSEKTEQYINEILKDDGLTYRNVSSNPELEKVARDWSLEHLGYIIEPEFLFSNMVANIPESETQSMEWSSGKHKLFSVEDLESAISKLTGSTIGRPSEAAFDKLFDDMNLQDKDLGREVSDRTKLIGEVMLKVSLISFGSDAGFDVLGTAYMILIGLFASDAGKKGGEYFTPTCASSLLAKLASLGKSEVNNVCDPCAGSGSLLLQIRDNVPTHRVGHYYAGEKNGSTYNLLRMNLLMHDVPYNEFTAFNADTLGPDNFVENGRPVLFDVQVSNPPFSAKWNDSLKMLEDPRFSAPGELAPHSKADLAFVEHMVSHMSDDGAIAVILPHGALYRPDSEAKIREYLVEKLNVVDAVIGLPSNLFHGTKIPVAIMILKKNRGQNADNIFFMDASNQFTKINKQKANILEAKHIQFILDSYKARNNVSKVSEKATIEDVRANGFKLNILAFVKLNQIDKNVDEVQALKDLSFFEASEKEKKKELDAQLSLAGISELKSEELSSISNIHFSGSDGKRYPAWQKVVLKSILTERCEKSGGKLRICSVAVKEGVVDQLQHLGRSYAAADTSKYNAVEYGDVVYTKSPTGEFPFGIVKQSQLKERVAVSPLYGVFVPKSYAIGLFLHYYFMSPANTNNYLAPIIQKGAKNTINISNDTFLSSSILMPTTDEEIFKIVAFINSVNEFVRIKQNEFEAWNSIQKGLIKKVLS